MTTKYITQEIILSPSLLGKDYKKHLLSHAKEKLIGTLHEGIVKDVIKISKIKSNMISRNGGNVIFNAKIKVVTIKPIKGKEIKMKVAYITSKGILFNKEQVIRCLVTSDNLKDYKFNPKPPIWINDNDAINVGDIMTIIPDTIRFENNMYSCIGKIKHDKI